MIRIPYFIAPLAVAVLVPSAFAGPAVDIAHAREIATQHACFGCHAVEKKLVGPAYRDVAARYAGKPGAASALVAHIRNGSSGNWGAIPMPPNAIDAGDAQIVAQWILSGAKAD